MKSTRCDEVVGGFVAYTRDQLKPLEKERIRSHLGNCAACATVCDDLDAGLSAARSWQPDVSMSELDILGQRLHPYMQPRRSAWRPAWAALAFSCAALASVTALGLWLASGPWAEPSTRSLPSSRSSMISLAEPTIGTGTPNDAPNVGRTGVARTTPTPHLRLLNGDGWDGQVISNRGDPNELAVTMTRGFAVFSFVGGAGRRLSISTPDVRVEVVGTRFFVEVRNEVTIVGVAEGRVRVLTLDGVSMLDAGERLVVGNVAGDETRAGDARAAAYLDDSHLLAGEHAERPLAGLQRMRTRARRSAKRPAGAADLSDLFAHLERAEELAKLGEFRAAIAQYRLIATDPRPTYAPYRGLSRYEIARLWGFRLGEIERARSILRLLARRNKGEVSRQATLALCELDLRARPCDAAACLRDLTERSTDFQLGREAERLLTQLQLGNLECTRVPE